MSNKYDYDNLSKEQEAHVIAEVDPIDEVKATEAMLDETHGYIEVAGYSYSTSEILQNVDEIAFREAVVNYMDSLIKDGEVVEIDGDYYNADEVDDALDEFEDGE